MKYVHKLNRTHWLRGGAAVLTASAFLFSGMTLAEDEDEAYDMDAAGGELVEPCEEGADDVSKCTVQNEVQSRGKWVPSTPFKLQSAKYNTCLRPTGTSKGDEVRLYSCANYSSRYWTPIESNQSSNTDRVYKLRNNWTGYCLTIDNSGTSSTKSLKQEDCGQAGSVEFESSPNMFAGEYVVVANLERTGSGGLPRYGLFCMYASSSRYNKVTNSPSRTPTCAFWQSQLWHRRAW
jgi:hypothetical protein